MKTTSTLVFTLAAAIPFVAAHGFVQDMTIDGQFIKGNPVGGTAGPSGIRQVFSANPIKGAMNRDVNCGSGAQKASLVLNAMPGSNLTFNWRGADGSKWPHNTGPLLTYMASCQNVTCDQFDAINAQWFKIQQQARRQDGNWTQQDLMDGGVASASIPSNLAPGNYLVRHEIIALHLAQTLGGAEFYEGCAQLNVGGNETGVPDPSDLVSLPGAYSDNDPGIFDKDAFDQNVPYQFPGPAVATISQSNSTSGDPGSGSGTGSGDPSTPSGSCYLKSQPKANMNRPRQLSRVMRTLRLD